MAGAATYRMSIESSKGILIRPKSRLLVLKHSWVDILWKSTFFSSDRHWDTDTCFTQI